MSKRRDVSAELIPVAEHYALNELWDKFLKPRLPELSDPLLFQAITNLELQHRTLSAWQQGDRTGDHITWHRSAIEPHEQDEYPEPVDVVIDVARDSLEWMVKNQPDNAANWCKRLIKSDVPISRRLGVHVLSERTDLTADGKSQFLLENAEIHDLPAHHETFRLLKLIYPDLAEASRRAVIAAILTFNWTDEDDERKEERTAYEHFRWLSWLDKSDSKCVLLKAQLKIISEKYPDFKSSEHPDLTHWVSTGWVEPQSPWSVEELLEKPANDWLPELLEFKGEGFSGPSSRGLATAVMGAAKKDFDWGLGLAKSLGAAEFWESSIWPSLLQGWSDMEINEAGYRDVLGIVGREELYRQHPRDIAQALFAIVKDEGKPHACELLEVTNALARELWSCLAKVEGPIETDDWLQRAINHPGGILAEYWLHSLSLYRNNQDPKPDRFNDEYTRAFTEIAEDNSLAGKLGRSVLASQLAFIMASDRAWADKYLVPLYDPEGDPDDFQSAWDGFLGWGRLNADVVDTLTPLFLKAARCLNDQLASRLNRFVEYFTAVILFGVENPLDDWIPVLFRYGGIEARNHFASDMTRHLRKMDDEQQVELWNRWLRQYWEGRIQNVPAPLEAEETKNMLGWLPKFSSLFPQAVDLAVQMPPVKFERFHLIYDLRKSELVERYPREILRLFTFLADTNSPGYVWYGLQEILACLRALDLPVDLIEELEALSVRIGVFDQ